MKPCASCPSPAKCKKAGKCLKRAGAAARTKAKRTSRSIKRGSY